jgi:hypothetical protein
MEAEFTYGLLSAVGSYLSLQEGVYCDCGGAHPTAVKRFRAIQLDSGAHGLPSPASLTSIFPQRAVFTALMADSIVAKALGADTKPESLAGRSRHFRMRLPRSKTASMSFPATCCRASRFMTPGMGTFPSGWACHPPPKCVAAR